MKYGYSDEEIKKVIRENTLRVLKRIWVSDIFLKKYKVKVPWKLFLIMALVNIAITIPVMSLGLTWGLKEWLNKR